MTEKTLTPEHTLDLIPLEILQRILTGLTEDLTREPSNENIQSSINLFQAAISRKEK